MGRGSETETNITEWICFMLLFLRGLAETDQSHVVWTEKPLLLFHFGRTSVRKRHRTPVRSCDSGKAAVYHMAMIQKTAP